MSFFFFRRRTQKRQGQWTSKAPTLPERGRAKKRIEKILSARRSRTAGGVKEDTQTETARHTFHKPTTQSCAQVPFGANFGRKGEAGKIPPPPSSCKVHFVFKKPPQLWHISICRRVFWVNLHPVVVIKIAGGGFEIPSCADSLPIHIESNPARHHRPQPYRISARRDFYDLRRFRVSTRFLSLQTPKLRKS